MSKSSLQKLLSRVSRHLLLGSMSVGAMLGSTGSEFQVHGQDNSSKFNSTQFNQAFQGNPGFKPVGKTDAPANLNQFGLTPTPATQNAPKAATNAFSPSDFSPKSKAQNATSATNAVANIRPANSVNPGRNTFKSYALTQGNAADVSKQLKSKLGNLVEVVTDQTSNRLLVNCTVENHRLVEQVIKGFETSSTTNVNANQQIKSIRSFNVSTDIIRSAANELSQLYVDKDRIIVAADEIVGKLMIFATSQDYEEVATYLKQKGFLKAPQENKEVATPGTKQHQLKNIGWRALEAAVIQAWGAEVRTKTSADGAFSQVQLPSYKNNSSLIQIDRRNNAVQVQSSGRQLDGIMKLLSVLDQEHGIERVELIKSSEAAIDQVQSTVSMYKFASLQQESQPKSTSSAIIGKRAPKNGVYAIYQDQDQGAAAGNAQDDTLGPIGRVEIITIPGTDIIILKGDPKDVARVRALIDQIEKTSEDYQPQIEMFMLKHVDNAAVQLIIDEVYTAFYEPSLGDTAITALVKPNALLLVGPAEGVKQAKEIASKLDVPVDGATEFKVFRIKHMSAVDAENRLRSFYQGQTTQGGVGANAGGQNAIGQSEYGGTGLAVKLRLTSDYRSNTLFVHAKPGDMEEITKFIEELDVSSTDGEADDLKVIRLKNSVAEELAPILQDILTGQLQGAGQSTTGTNGNQGGFGQQQQQGQFSQIRSAMLALQAIDKDGELVRSNILFDTRITADSNSNSLVIKAPKGSMQLIKMLIGQLDQLPDVESRIKVFTLKNSSAVQVQETIQSFFETTQGGGGGGAGGGGTSIIPLETGGFKSTIVSLRLASNAQTNTLLAAGSDGDLNIVEALITRLDENIPSDYTHRVIRLQNVTAETVQSALADWISARNEILGADPRIAGGGDGSLETVKRQLSVVAETETNSLIITGSVEYIHLLEDIIADIDFKKQVVIQAVIAQVELSDTFEFGIEWGVQDSMLFDRGIGGLAENTIGYPFNQSGLGNTIAAGTTGLATRENLAGQVISNLNVGRSNSDTGYGGLVVSAGNESINVLLRALDDKSKVDILSRPQITTMENIQASVQVGQDLPYVTGVDNDQTAGGSTTFATDFLNLGVLLAVTPRVRPDGEIWMRVDVSNSSVADGEGVAIQTTAAGGVVFQPIINTQNLQTDVVARSGQTIVLGGLIQTNKSESNRGIPFLSGIPAIGRLFSFDSSVQTRSELFVILRPVVIDSEEDRKMLLQTESDRLNWIASDVAEMHGPIYEDETLACETETVYPDRTPTGYHYEASSKNERGNKPRAELGSLAPLNSDSARSSRTNPPPMPNENRFSTDYQKPLTGEQSNVVQTSATQAPANQAPAKPKKKKNFFPFNFK